jgi:hypothetical protein
MSRDNQVLSARDSAFSVSFVALYKMSDAQNKAFVEWPANDLHANRQRFGIRSARNGNGRQSRQVHRDGVNLRKIHFKQIVQFFAQLECRRGRGGRHQAIHFMKSVVKIIFNKRAHLLPLSGPVE